MKKNILIVITFITCLFCSFTSVDALTKVNFGEESNGKIKTTLHFEEGFVGGVELVLKLEGDVSVKNFAFDNKISSSNYEKSYDYNNGNHTLTIRITTGGVGSSHNLLNSKKELLLGNIELSTDSLENVNYKLSESSLTVVDNSWNSKKVSQEHITLGDKTEFTYVVTNTSEENPPVDEDKDEEEDKKDEDDNKDDNNKEENVSGNNGGTTSNDSNNPNSGNTTNNNTNNTNNNNNNNDNNNNSNNDESNVIGDDNNTTEPETDDNNLENNTSTDNDQEEDNDSWLLILGCAVAVFAVGVGIYVFVVKKREEQ